MSRLPLQLTERSEWPYRAAPSSPPTAKGVQDAHPIHPTFHTRATHFLPAKKPHALLPAHFQSWPPLLSQISALFIRNPPCHVAQPSGVPAEHRAAVLTEPWFPNTKETTKLNQHPGFSYSLKLQQTLLSSAVQFRSCWSFTPGHVLWEATPVLHLSLATIELIAAAGCRRGLCTKHQSSAAHRTEGG